MKSLQPKPAPERRASEAVPMRMCMCGHPNIAHEHLGGRCEAGGTATRERILHCDCERFKEQKQAPPPTPPPPAPAAGLLTQWRKAIDFRMRTEERETEALASLEDFTRRARATLNANAREDGEFPLGGAYAAMSFGQLLVELLGDLGPR